MPASERFYWLSFCDPAKPEGESFLGACIVQFTEADVARLRHEVEAFIQRRRAEVGKAAVPIGDDAIELAVAIRVSREKGINPGGEVLSYRLPNTDGSVVTHFGAIGFAFDRLYARDELQAFPGGEFSTIGEQEQEGRA